MDDLQIGSSWHLLQNRMHNAYQPQYASHYSFRVVGSLSPQFWIDRRGRQACHSVTTVLRILTV